MTERAAFLCFDGWAGARRTPIIIVGETPKRYRIRVEARTKLAGRNRWIEPGETKLVPKSAVRLDGVR